MSNPFAVYDEFASDVIDDACRFLIRKRVFTREEVEVLPPVVIWKEAVKRGWKAPEKP
jgi:hypothetical protein